MRVFVEGIEFYGYHGVSEAEQEVGHRYLLDLAFEVISERSAESDDVLDTVDYGAAAGLAVQIAAAAKRRTVERVAAEIGDGLLAAFPLAASVEVRLCKLLHPCPVAASEAGVELVRRR